jgi:hypothetical protein
MPTLTEADEGKNVVNQDGEMIGMISAFRGGKAYVDPDPGLTDRIKTTLGWEDVDEDSFVLEDDQVHTITDDEVRIRD